MVGLVKGLPKVNILQLQTKNEKILHFFGSSRCRW